MNESQLTVVDIAREVANILKTAEDPRMKLAAAQMILKHSLTVAKLNGLIQQIERRATKRVLMGGEEVELTQIERELKLAADSANFCRRVLDEGDDALPSYAKMKQHQESRGNEGDDHAESETE